MKHMPRSRHTTGLLVIISLAVIGYLLVTLPPKLLEQYHTATEMGPWAAYVYLGVCRHRAPAASVGLLVWGLVRIWRNTRRKKSTDDRRNLSPSEMSAADRARELADNLATGKEFATGDGVSPRLRAEIEAAVAELEAKRQSRKLEIVAFGTISSGKSSLLNALAGREVFRTNVVGGTTVARSEIPWPAGDSVVLVDTPGLAEVRGESRAAEAAEAAKNADLVLFVVDGPLKAYERDLLAALAAMEKRIVVCLNKEDWYDDVQRDGLAQAAGRAGVAGGEGGRRGRGAIAAGRTRAGACALRWPRGRGVGYRDTGYQPAGAADAVDCRSRWQRIAPGESCCCNRAGWSTNPSSGCSRRSTSEPTR